jgi:sugar phosphate isomerase/epimerase
MSDLALSTMWGIGQFPSLADFFTAASALGFGRFELNHAVTSAMLHGLHLNGQRITSIHEPCPADISSSALKARNWLISAPDEDDRQKGVAATRRSIDLALELGAQVVIVHPGQVDIASDLEKTVRDLYQQGRLGEPEYLQARGQLVAARALQAETNMRSVRRSLFELAEYAARLGIRLGLENRYHYHEIPLPDELDELLSMGCGDVVGYWHDVGHAQALENLGLGSHEEWLQRFAQRMVGVHLHDIVGLQDHLAAGLGCLDWDMIARYLPSDALRTCEFQTGNSPQEVIAGVRLLVEKGCVIEA